MQTRHVFSTPDLRTAEAVLDAARAGGISNECLSVVARGDIEMESISSDLQEADSDFIPAAIRGAGYGGAAGLLAGLVAVVVSTIGLKLAGRAAATAAGPLVGKRAADTRCPALPNPVRARFDDEIKAGRILVLIDASKDKLAAVEPAMVAAGATVLPFEATTALIR